jgi:MFS transporter, OPA family, sugar phosphate sensor protein UhpC
MRLLQPAPYVEELTDNEQVKARYSYWRIRVFYSMFLGYAFYYFTRKSFTFAAPALMRDLNLSMTDIGLIGSIWAITYGLSKFISGIIGDRSNARYFMPIGLMATGICNIVFGCFSSVTMFAICWGLNGWFQGFGWPACARLLTHWYSQSERGRWWSLWNTSHNIGGAIIPILTAFFAQYYGWRFAMVIPGIISIGMAFILINRLTDTPQALGLPPIERFRNDYPTEASKHEKERELTTKEILFKYVLSNPYIWVLAVCYFFVYIIRMAVNDWSMIYLVNYRKYSPLEAGSIIFWYDFGGIFGSLAAGWASDKIFRGRRGPVNALFSFGVIMPLMLFGSSTANSIVVDSALIFVTGFFIYGPQMLIGMQAAEVAHKKAAATASGFTGWSAYLGSAISYYPLSKIIQELGWTGFFSALTACVVISALLMLSLWNIRSRESAVEQKEEETLEPVAT